MKGSDQWNAEITKLRAVLAKAKLEETVKWNLPCFTHEGNNIVILQPFKACLAMMFFKGKLLKDPKKLLVDNGPNSQSAMRLEFRSTAEIAKLAPVIKAYVQEALKIEAAGLEVEFKKKPEAVPAELKQVFAQNPKLKKAFYALTPGRQRAYLLHFSGAKQAATRQARIQKHALRILAGKGMMDR
jgi:uncharacterized protein YdeI (YjbR/CyaY-like superfamily)